MEIIKGWLRRYSQPSQPIKRDPHELPRESTLTAISGGMGSTELLIRLEIVLGDIKSEKPIIKHAYELAGLSHSLQARLLSDLADLSSLSYQHSYEFLCVATDALTGMEPVQYDKWAYDIKNLLHEGYDEAASELIQKHPSYIEAPSIANLSAITETLEKLIFSLRKTEIPITPSSEAGNAGAYTDGYQLFLPAKISHFDKYENNYRLYKILTFHLLEQIRSGTWKALDSLTETIKQNGEHHLKLFSTIETLRINATIEKEFPGIWRDIKKIHHLTKINYPYELLENSRLDSAFDSLALVNELIKSPIEIPELVYQPIFLPEKVQQATLSGLYSVPLKELETVDDAILKTPTVNKKQLSPHPPTSSLAEIDDQLVAEDKHSDTPTADTQETLTSDYSESRTDTDDKKKKDIFYYKEWDTSLQKYRTDWCHVTEMLVEDISEDGAIEPNQALKYAEFRIKKTLDLLVNDQRFMRFQNDGDDIDIDAWVSARSDRNKHADDYQNVYIRNNKNTRNVAIMFAVDISGSTRGWKNTAIKQSTWLLCKTLARLDDQYAVYAFSGSGRKNCHIYPVKTFSDTYNSSVQARICAMQPQQYTRLGSAIRHLASVLGKASAKTRILFVLTDGKPDDIDSYRGQYAIEDTRHALNEAKALSLNPFVLTFDKDGMDYLPHMLGSNRYQLISDVTQLPVQISTIYKHLTT